MEQMTANEQMTQEQAEQITTYLEELLSLQIHKLKQYDLDGAMAMADQSQEISTMVTNRKILEMPGLEQKRSHIEGLYKELCLILASQRQEVGDKLGQIRNGLKTLNTYSGK